MYYLELACFAAEEKSKALKCIKLVENKLVYVLLCIIIIIIVIIVIIIMPVVN